MPCAGCCCNRIWAAEHWPREEASHSCRGTRVNAEEAGRMGNADGLLSLCECGGWETGRGGRILAKRWGPKTCI